MRVFLTGGTGFVGRHLSARLRGDGHEVSVLSRAPKGNSGSTEGVRLIPGDPNLPGDWQEDLAGHDAVINLAGAPIFTRWTKSHKQLILESRLRSTSNVVDAIARTGKAEIVLLSASAVGYYGFREDEVLDETVEPGDDFLATVARNWEAAAATATGCASRVVLCRFGIVLGKGGALDRMVREYRHRPIVVLGSGRQWFSWIHVDDLARIFLFLLENERISGAINCVSPNAVRNRELTELLAEAMGKRVLGLSLPGFALKLMLGEFGSVLTEGQRVIPRRLLDGGFEFRFPDLKGALADLVEGPAAIGPEAGMA